MPAIPLTFSVPTGQEYLTYYYPDGSMKGNKFLKGELEYSYELETPDGDVPEIHPPFVDTFGDPLPDVYNAPPEVTQIESVPPWIKSNVQWWSDGLISDAEFVAALEHLISENITQSPRISIVTDEDTLAKEQRINDDISVPPFFKTNAKWWSDGLIDDTTFVTSVEFLVEEEIIDSPSIKVTPEPDDDFGRPENDSSRNTNSGTFHVAITNI